MPIAFTPLGAPVNADRQWAEGLVPRVGGGWSWMGQFYNAPNGNPTEWPVIHLETGTVQIFQDSPYTPGARGKYVNSANFHAVKHQLRAANDRVFFPAISCWWWYYDPSTNSIIDMGRAPGTADTAWYQACFNHDGSKLYFGSIGINDTTPQWLPCVAEIDPNANPPTSTFLCRVGSGGHTQVAYAYYLWADGDYLYVLVGEDIWDVVAVHIPTKTQTVLATATTNAWAYFYEVPGQGLTVQLYTNLGRPDQTLQWFWVNNGANAGSYTPGVAPPFTPHDVSQYTNPLVGAPDLDETFLPNSIGWRAGGTTNPYTYISLGLQYISPINIEALAKLPDQSIFGNAVQYQGFFNYNPSTATMTYYGLPAAAQQVSEVVYLLVGNTLYGTGYPNAPLIALDTTKPETSTNPALLGHYDGGSNKSGVKTGTALAYSLAYNRLYMAGVRDRNGSGSGIGYYDINSRVFDGTFAGLNYYVGQLGLVVFDDVDRVVFAGLIGPDPSTPIPPPTSSQLVLFDHNLNEIERQTPIVGLTDTGHIFKTGEADVVMGLSRGGQLVYRWNIVTKVLLGQAALAGAVGISFQDADNTVLAVIGSDLCRINPVTLAVTVIGALLNPALTTMATRGDELFTATDSQLLLASDNPSVLVVSPGNGVGVGQSVTLTINGATTLAVSPGAGAGVGQPAALILNGLQVLNVTPGLGRLMGTNVTLLLDSSTRNTTGSETGWFRNNEVSPIVRGQPLYSDGSGTIRLACADGSLRSRVIGLVNELTVPPQNKGQIALDGLISADPGEWDVVCGTSGGLVDKTVYYLDPTTPGKLTSVPPSASGKEVVPVLLALSPFDARIIVSPPILL